MTSGTVHVVEYGLPVADTLETGVQTTAHIHHHRIGVLPYEAAHGTVENHPRTTQPTSLNFAPSKRE